MNIVNIFCQSLSVTSHVKTFLTVCRFRTDLVSVWTARGICSSKNCHPFEWLGLSVRKKLSSIWTAWAIRSKGKCDLFKRLGLSVWKQLSSGKLRTKITSPTAKSTPRAIGHDFLCTLHPFKQLGVSVQKRNWRLFEQLKLHSNINFSRVSILKPFRR